MDADTTANKVNEVAKKVFAEARGRYLLIDDKMAYSLDFPINATLMQNYDAVSHLRNEIWKALEEQKKKEDEKACTENCSKDPCDCKCEEIKA